MRGRTLRTILAALWLLWTGVIIPVHTRGLIPLEGRAVNPCACAGADAAPAETPLPMPSEASSPALAAAGERPTCCPRPGERQAPAGRGKVPRPGQSCAICTLAAHLAAGPGIPPLLAEPRLLERVTPAFDSPSPSHSPPDARHCRGPPSAA